MRERPAQRRQPRDNSKLDFQSSLLSNSRIDFNLPNWSGEALAWWGEAPERLSVLTKRFAFIRRRRIAIPERTPSRDAALELRLGASIGLTHHVDSDLLISLVKRLVLPEPRPTKLEPHQVSTKRTSPRVRIGQGIDRSDSGRSLELLQQARLRTLPPKYWHRLRPCRFLPSRGE